jgi:ATP-dependent RNA helicase SUPV3L1/SUV3
VRRVERLDGDIDVLLARLASVRTWTYVAHQASWLDNCAEWQDRTRIAEDKLSNALHEKLTQRFVDKRTRLLVNTLNADETINSALHDDGSLEVEGHHLGHLNGFRFVAGESESALAAKVLGSAATKALREKVSDRISMLQAEPDTAFSFTHDGHVVWRDAPVAKMIKGASLTAPAVKVLTSDLLDADQKNLIEARLHLWLKDLVKDRLGPLLAAQNAPVGGVARGLVYQLGESLGALPRHEANDEIKGLERVDRQALRRLGIHIGRHLVYIPALLRPAAVELSVLLWALFEEVDPLGPPPAGRVSLKREKHEPEGWLRAAGFRPAGALFIRADMLERMAELGWKRLEEAKGPFVANEDFLALAGCGVDELPPILQSLGFAPANEPGKWQPKSRNMGQKGKTKPHAKPDTKSKPAHKAASKRPEPAPFKVDPDSPFAKLQQFKLNK